MNTFIGIRQCILFPMILVAIFIFTDGCKKEDTISPPVPPQTTPVFTVDHIFISVGGKDYIQFVTRCTSESVKLDTARITDPQNNRFYYEYYSDTTDYQVFCKDESFTFPEDFLKQPGIWKFTFIGQRYKDNSDFTSVVNDTIAN
jgi:hypothetical protein